MTKYEKEYNKIKECEFTVWACLGCEKFEDCLESINKYAEFLENKLNKTEFILKEIKHRNYDKAIKMTKEYFND